MQYLRLPVVNSQHPFQQVSRSATRATTVVAFLIVLALMLGACGRDDSSDDASESSTTVGGQTTLTTAPPGEPVVTPTTTVREDGLSGTADPSAATADVDAQTDSGVGGKGSGSGTLTGGPANGLPAVMIKVPNDGSARHVLTGIEDADIIFEELVEGGVTRFAAVFNSTLPDQVQPVRSVRGPDPDLALSVGGVFAYSGGAGPFVERINSVPVVAVNESSAGSSLYRVAGKAPYNLAASAKALAALSDEPARAPFRFSSAALAGGQAATNVSVKVSNAQTSNFKYDAGSGVYTRYNGSAPEVSGGVQLGFENVVVIGVATGGTGVIDTAGSESPQSFTVGSGTAWLFRDGKVYVGKWSRAHETAPWEIIADDGSAYTLAPGRTNVVLLPVAGTYAGGKIGWN